jgi:hypothetical protein
VVRNSFFAAELAKTFFYKKFIDIKVMRNARAQLTTGVGSAALPYLEEGKLTVG